MSLRRNPKSFWQRLSGESKIYQAKYVVAGDEKVQDDIQSGLIIRFFDEVDINSLSIEDLTALYGMVARSIFVVNGNPFRDWNQMLLTYHLKKSNNSSPTFSKNPYLKSFSRGYGNCVRVNLE